LNQTGAAIDSCRVSPQNLGGLVNLTVNGDINQTTAKAVLVEMYNSGTPAETIVIERGLRQVSDLGAIQEWVERVLADNPEQVSAYLAGKETVSRWLFGQVMRLGQGKANPQLVQQELGRQLEARKGHSFGQEGMVSP